MARILGVLNYKGGSGKTTTVINLAAGLVLRGFRVLCLDFDPQGSLATHLGVSYTHSMADMLLKDIALQDCVVSVQSNLDIIASDADLLQVEGILWRPEGKRLMQELLAYKLQQLNNEANTYDFVIFDYSPSTSLLSESSLHCIQELIVPVSMDQMSLVGTQQVIQTLQTINSDLENEIKISLIVPTLYYNQVQKDREIMKMLRHYFGSRVTAPIRATAKLSEAQGHQMSIYQYAPRSRGAYDYARLVERVATCN